MKPIRRTYTTTGAQAWIPLDHWRHPFQVTAAIDLSSGGVVSVVEYTTTDVQNASLTPIVAGSVPVTTYGTAETAELSTPATAIRLTVTTAPVTVEIVQSGR